MSNAQKTLTRMMEQYQRTVDKLSPLDAERVQMQIAVMKANIAREGMDDGNAGQTVFIVDDIPPV